MNKTRESGKIMIKTGTYCLVVVLLLLVREIFVRNR